MSENLVDEKITRKKSVQEGRKVPKKSEKFTFKVEMEHRGVRDIFLIKIIPD